MTTKKDDIRDPESVLDAYQSAADDEEARTVEQDINDNFLAEFAGEEDIEVKIYAQGKNARDTEYLFATTPQGHTMGQLLDICRDDYGGGSFRIMVRRDGKLAANRQFKVRAPIRRDQSTNDLREEVRRAKQEQEHSLSSVLAQMQQNTMTMIQAGQQQQMDMMKLMLSNKPEKSGMDLSDPNTLVALKQIFGGDDNKSDPMEIFMRGIEVARDFGGGKETNEMDVLLKGIQSLAPGLSALAARQGLEAPKNRVHPGEKGIQQPQHEQPAASPQQNMQQLIAVLLEAAKNNNDPAPFVDKILELTDADMAYSFFSTPEGKAEIVRLVPEANQYMAWLDRLGEAMDKATEPEQGSGTDDDDEGATGNAAPGDNRVSIEHPTGTEGHPPNTAGDGSTHPPGQG